MPAWNFLRCGGIVLVQQIRRPRGEVRQDAFSARDSLKYRAQRATHVFNGTGELMERKGGALDAAIARQ
jgi:N-acetylglucosamine-6-phosphate deacetylase